MRKKAAIAAPFLLGAIVCFYLAVPKRASGFQVTPAKLDLGEVAQGQQLSGTFEITNNHPGIVTIVNIISSCGCVNATPTCDTLKPNEKSTINVVWSTGSRRGRSGIDVTLLCRLHDGTPFVVPLRVEGTVVPDIHRPNEIQFQHSQRGQQVVEFRPGKMTNFSLTNARCNHPAFTVVESHSHVFRIAFEPQQWVATDHSQPSFIVNTNSENEPIITIPIIISSQQQINNKTAH